MEKLLEGKCEACKADAPLVTPEERKTLMPQIPGWNIIEVDGIEQLTCSFAFKDYLSALNFVNQVANLAEAAAASHPAWPPPITTTSNDNSFFIAVIYY